MTNEILIYFTIIYENVFYIIIMHIDLQKHFNINLTFPRKWYFQILRYRSNIYM